MDSFLGSRGAMWRWRKFHPPQKWAPDFVRIMWRNVVQKAHFLCQSPWTIIIMVETLEFNIKLIANVSQVQKSNCRGTKLGGNNTDTNSTPHPSDHPHPPTVKAQPHPGAPLPQGPRHPPLLQLRRDPDQVPRLQPRWQSQDGRRGCVRCSFSWDLCHGRDGRRD